MLEVLTTARNVAGKSRQVQIVEQSLKRFSRKMLAEKIQSPAWDSHHHFFDEGEETVAYLLVLDTINFCFWPPSGQPKWVVDYKSEKLSGYYALAASLKTAVESGVPITDASYLAELSLDDLKRILGGQGELQLMERRLKNLNELGHVLLSEYKGNAYRFVEHAGGSALKLAELLAEKLSSFSDVSEYLGQKVLFLKRAQIFSADLYGAFKGKKWGSFEDMNELTAFADYKLPQVLRHLGILRYTEALSKKIDQGIYLDPGSPEEVEIRANTVWAVELIRQELERAGEVLRAFEIDWILWNLGQKKEFKNKPYHRVVTVFY
jgi:hypothetical protein